MQLKFVLPWLILALTATPAAAELPKSWQAFLEESSAAYSKVEAGHFEDQLYAAAKTAPTREVAVADFGRRLRLDPARAGDYAELIVDSVLYFHSCESADSCVFAPGTPLYDRIRQLTPTEATGGLLSAILETAALRGEVAGQIPLIEAHPAALSLLRHFYEYGADTGFLAAALLKVPDDPTGLPPLLFDQASFSGTQDEMSGLVYAVLETTEARMADTPAGQMWRLQIAQQLLDEMLRLGLTHAAVERYLAYPDAVRNRLPFLPVGWAPADQCRQAGDSLAFANRMAAALWVEGHEAEARALWAFTLPAGWRKASPVSGFDPVREALHPTVKDGALFTLYLDERRGQKKGTDTCGNEIGGLQGGGVLFQMAQHSASEREIVARRLQAAGYGDMAAWLRSQGEYRYISEDPSLWQGREAQIPDKVRVRQTAWAERIAAARTAETERLKAAVAGPIHVAAPAPVVWAEKPLPEGVAAWQGDEGPEVPKSAQLPERMDYVLRYEASGEDAAVVFASGEYDMSGEIPAFGLWLGLKRKGRWEAPLYLGMQQHFPYVVTPGSHLPLIRDDHLQLEVRAREIDPDTIIFPPVNTQFKREADGLYLDIPLAELRADRDGDGLTDIEERRIGLDPARNDSDGDGVDDGRDSLPLTAYHPNSDSRTDQIARIILRQLMGHDAGAIVVAPRGKTASNALDDILSATLGTPAPEGPRGTMFIVSARDIFSGIVQTPFRLIVYSPADLDHLGRGKVPFYPPQVTTIFASPDGSAFYVDWSASWVGGSFIVRCKGDKCSVKELSRWIT
ncbi:hypothetical protein [Asticcacaulis sp. YBE204]|uniref:hypothetical protein n=1 Tax=Asticcacaulis sp. YBE204 TaxID=1282363 RepID=UPI0003C405DC|nr:hypothetical protein [Asticcacaulis sp. YBE204]ESQ80544.1 hypothetical protein AEYBE204_04555 [Asticcacaulis sp. YBE204]